MPRGIRRSSRSSMVPAAMAEPLLQETLLRAKARKRAAQRNFDPALGSTYEEAEASLAAMREDINKYGEYVYDKSPLYFHRYWNKVVDDVIKRRVPQNKILIIAPPGTAKSTWNAIIRATHYMGNNPDHHLITVTSSDPNASDFDGSWTRTVEENPRFAQVFPDSRARPYKRAGWSSDGRFLRGIEEGDRTPSFKAVGLNTTVMGNRANGIILDDPLDQKNAQSETEQRKAKAYLDQTLIPRLHPDIGWMLAVMTRFSDFDLASHMIRLARESGDWIYLCFPMVATIDDPVGRKTGQLLWPERFNEEYVKRERKRLTIAEFNMIHQGDPAGMGGDVFTSPELFKDMPAHFERDIRPMCRIIIVSDLAYSESKRTCFTVIMTVAIDRQFNMYILHVYRARVSTPAVARVFISLIQVARPVITGIEADGFHKQLIVTLARTIMSKVMCNIQLIVPDKDKRSRAMLPAARVENGMVYVRKKAKWYESFVMECLGFPNTRYKDQVDTFGLAAYVVVKMEELAEDTSESGEPPQVVYSNR